jgi:hypothetical protein
VCHCASLGPVLLPAEARAVNLLDYLFSWSTYDPCSLFNFLCYYSGSPISFTSFIYAIVDFG